jgi:ADP-heptose:LPS heptosyltransferase
MSHLAAVLQIGSFGDSIVSLPVIRSLVELLPDCSDYVLISRYDTATNVMPSHVFDMSVKAKHKVNYRGSGGKINQILSTAALFAKIRYYRPRACVYLMPAERNEAQVQRDRAFFKAAGIRNLIGFRTLTKGELPSGDDLSFTSTEAFLRFERVWGAAAREKFLKYCRTPLLAPVDEARSRVREWLSAGRRYPERPLVALCPFSNFVSKNLPNTVTVELLKMLEDSGLAEVVMVGAEKDKLESQMMRNQSRRGLDACGAFSPSESAALIQECSLAICADSGPMHLAGALGIPTVTAFSRINGELSRWFPFGERHTILYREVACAGCRRTHCPVEGHPCMEGISAQEIFAAAVKQVDDRSFPLRLHSGTRVIDWSVTPDAERSKHATAGRAL